MKHAKSAPHTSPARLVGLGALFLAFLKICVCGFAGGLIWARRVVVEQRQWMDGQEFAEALTLCQLMPGPNIVGVAVCSGAGAARRDPGCSGCREAPSFFSAHNSLFCRTSSVACQPRRQGC